ncbi:MAG: ArsI/CadI family heavy metal resistance metalloenzyme [Candidatus Dormibacteria bacterium]
MGRVQLALNVSDLDEAVSFYSKLFRTAPAKRRPGYANFAVADPPLKLVLFENPAQAGTLNHLGVEVGTADEVVTATRRLAAEGLQTDVEDGVTCCHALQDKVWVNGADTRWEVYTVLADVPVSEGASTGGCCATAASTEPTSAGCASSATVPEANADATHALSA